MHEKVMVALCVSVTAFFIAEPPSISCCGAGFLMDVGVDVRAAEALPVLFDTALGVMSLVSKIAN